MIKPDVIVSWPRNCDYPLWRQFILENRTRFNLVIIVFTETNQGEDYRQFVRDATFPDYVLCIDSPMIMGKEDWRDVAIHQALIQSYNAEWLWFTEQDFIVEEGFWEALETAEKEGAEVMTSYDQTRMHPCNIFIKREVLLTRTRKNFGIVKDQLDHFGMIQRELEQTDTKIYVFPYATYEHLNGLSHNMTLIYNNQMPNWNARAFNKYLTQSLEVTVPLDPRYIALAERYLDQIGHAYKKQKTTS